MRSPAKRPLAFVAEYQFGDDNILTATHQEEVRLKNEERIRNAQSVLKLQELTISGEPSPTHNLKKLQQEQDRQGEIEQHNLILLHRLERIHQQVPRQFDVSHHSDAVLQAPRASNAGLRQRQQDNIAAENKKMKRRLGNTKGTFDLKQLAVDADRHRYFADQISKLARRRKVQESCKHLSSLAAVKAALAQPESFYVFDHHHEHEATSPTHKRKVSQPHGGHSQVYDWRGKELSCGEDDDGEDRRRIGCKLPPVCSPVARKYVADPGGSLTLSKTSKVIAAADLFK